VGSGSWSLFPRRAALFLRREIAWFGVSSFDVTRSVVWIRSTSQLLRRSPAPGGSELPTGSLLRRVAISAGFNFPAENRRKTGKFSVSASSREMEFRYFSLFFVFKFKNSKIFVKNWEKI